MEQLPRVYDHIAGRKLSRIEALADGVFAVAFTILVLDIKGPAAEIIKTNADLCTAFTALLPKLLIYVLSFMTLGIFWVGHTTQFGYIARSDRNLNWLSLLFLMMVCLLPFTTAFLSEFIRFRFAIVIYWLNILFCGIAIALHWNYACKAGLLEIPEAEKKMVNEAINRRVIVAQTLYAFGALLCLVNNYISIGFIILVQLNYAFSMLTRRFRM